MENPGAPIGVIQFVVVALRNPNGQWRTHRIEFEGRPMEVDEFEERLAGHRGVIVRHAPGPIEDDEEFDDEEEDEEEEDEEEEEEDEEQGEDSGVEADVEMNGNEE